MALSLFCRRPEGGPATKPLLDLRALKRPRRDQTQAQIRALCSTAYLGDGSAVCRVLGRFKMFVDTRDVGLSSHLMLDGYWEMWLTEALVEAVKPGMTTVDIGANLGYFTLLMAEQVGPDGAVHAFEPNPPIADRLANSIEINGFRERVTLHREPLGDEDGLDVALCVPKGEPKNAFIVPPNEDAIALKTRRFDNYPELDAADVIKIDAEASELAIWRGMSGVIERRTRPLTIFMEFAAARYDDPAGFLAEITGRGFTLGEVSLNDGVRPRTAQQILSQSPIIDQMLVLKR